MRKLMGLTAIWVFIMLCGYVVFTEQESSGGTNSARTVIQKDTSKQHVMTKCPDHVEGIRYYRDATWKWQDKLGLKRSKSNFKWWKVRSCEYAVWVAHEWVERAAKHRKAWKKIEQYELANRDFTRAAYLLGPIFGISGSRLIARAGAEGGTGGWVMNHQGSGAGGWLQFMEGTYYAYSGSAFREAWKRGYKVPWKFNYWQSPVGQALTGAYMFYLGLECAGVGWAASC